MATMYQVGKDVQSLENRIYQLENNFTFVKNDPPATNNDNSPDPLTVNVNKGCTEIIINLATLGTGDDRVLRYKILHLPDNDRERQCRWFDEFVTVKPSGHYTHEFKVTNLTDQLCNFETEVHIRNADGKLLHMWNYTGQIDPQSSIWIRYPGIHSAIQVFFDQIASATRSFVCSPVEEGSGGH